jgi:hypothetical protein
MQIIHTNEAETPRAKFRASLQASTHSVVNQSKFSSQQVLTAQRVHQMLSYLYTDPDAYLNFRKTRATIKINVFAPHREHAEQLAEYLQHLSSAGIEPVRSGTGLLFRIPRA